MNRLLDTSLSTEDIQGYMQKLSFPVTRKGDVLLVETPTYRPDLKLEVDLIEKLPVYMDIIISLTICL